jgi:CRISPR-associated protein Cas6/Cse3/CasE subtype I-E
MTWLTQITLDHATVARRHLRDNYDWHQVAWQCFPGRPDDARDFLTRLDKSPQDFRLLIVSPRLPTRPEWCPPNAFQSREISSEYFGRSRYAFPTPRQSDEEGHQSPQAKSPWRRRSDQPQ